jgi:RNA polymerase-interacting CarD/CdnL/TRCF family regulator
VLSTLRSKPQQLPDDYKERQEQIDEKVKTGHVMQLAQVVRDLTWHGERAHLTKRDSDLLRHGQDLLAAEMALVSGQAVSDSNKLILSVMTAAVANAAS